MNIFMLWGIIFVMFAIMFAVVYRETWLSWFGKGAKNNMLLWKHPSNGGGLVFAYRQDPPGRDWFVKWKRKHYKWCYEVEVEPDNFQIRPYEPKGAKIYLTPTELFDCRDWRCAGELFIPPMSFLEKLNAWVRVGMFGLLFLAILLIAGEMGQRGGG